MFEDRDKVFDGEDVLQETLITIGEKNVYQEPYINIYTSPKADSAYEPIRVDAETIK